jgi:hypothetical protein
MAKKAKPKHHKASKEQCGYCQLDRQQRIAAKKAAAKKAAEAPAAPKKKTKK